MSENEWHKLAFGFAKAVNILGGPIHTIKKNTEVLVVAVKMSGPDVNAEKIYFAVSRAAEGKKLQHKYR
jgi:hypothetical protein